MSYEVLARKYRPSNFEEVVGQSHIIQAITNSIASNKIHQAYIFSGTRGVGKTTLARILSKCLNCLSSDKPVTKPCDSCTVCDEIKTGRHLDFLEIDAASKTGVDDMRELLDTVQYKPSSGRYKIYLIDEVHMLSTSSFNALLKTLEEPPAHVIFIFATTDPEKIPKTVQSRCLQLNLKTINRDNLETHLQNVVNSEKIQHDKNSLALISDSAQGSVRDALTLLDQSIAHGNGALNEADVKALLGTIDDSLVYELIDAVVGGEAEKAFNIFYKIEELTPEYENVLKHIISFIHKVSLEQVLKNSNKEPVRSIAQSVDKEFIQLIYEIAVNSYSKFSIHPNPKEALEICILRMLAFNPLASIHDKTKSSNETVSEKKNLIQPVSSSKETVSVEIKNNIAEPVLKKSPAQIQPLKILSNHDWIAFFRELEMSVFVKNYYGNFTFLKMEGSEIYLGGDLKRNDIPLNVKKEFEDICTEAFKTKIIIKLEQSITTDGPLQQEEKENKVKQENAEDNIKNNESIKNFMTKFDATIKEKSIKPIN
ncbi:DNA polymerase III subunit gamma/tau [Gammaproteobacteria bacterium]|jgi:DNA polymerase-3 subunit gamma/tau|nr:DNA polymerase III subunit gamma/tau [Gammaproteobacteria bacterium]MDC3247570.1 DNA polymerase III subunit gamma/tau [Gammaproteobacteria bacterium]